MNRTTSLVAVAALIGAGAGSVLSGYLGHLRQENLEAESRAKVAALEERIAGLQDALAAAKRMAVPVESPDAAADEDGTPDTGDVAAAGPAAAKPIESIEDLIQEARPFLKRMSPLFDQFRKQAQAQWIDSQLAKWKESLGLSDEQVTSIRASLLEKADEMAAEQMAKLEDDAVPLDQALGGPNFMASQMRAMDEIMREQLDDDQFANYETEQLTQRAEMITNQANRDLEQMNEALELDEAQQDQVFDILVRTSPTFDPTMQVEGADGIPAESSGGGAGNGTEVDRDESIRQLLRPDQQAQYDAFLERRQGWRRGLFGGGFGR